MLLSFAGCGTEKEPAPTPSEYIDSASPSDLRVSGSGDTVPILPSPEPEAAENEAVATPAPVVPEPTISTPEPEASEVPVPSPVPPEHANSGLNTYATFEETLAAEMALIDDDLAALCGKLIYGEAGCVPDENNRRATLWCAINRQMDWGGTLEEIILAPNQFHGMAVSSPTPQQFIDEAREILAMWEMEKDVWIVPRLPLRFKFFCAGGDGLHNKFSTKFMGGEYWDGIEGFDVFHEDGGAIISNTVMEVS